MDEPDAMELSRNRKIGFMGNVGAGDVSGDLSFFIE